MSWKSLTIGKKITIGFGIVIILLIILGGFSFFGVGGIVKNASEVIDGKALDGELAQKEVDHLNWIGEVNKLLTDENVNKLEVETDHTKCGFGKWLYGEGRKQAEMIVPSLAGPLKEIEEPHRHLHESAIEIDKAYSAADPQLPGFICSKINDHLNWAGNIQKAILNNLPAIEVQTDHRLCAFGKWLYSDAAVKTAASDPELGKLLEEIKNPHERLHKTAVTIKASYRQVHEGLRNTLRLRLDDHRKWAAAVSKAIVARNQADVETDPDKCGFGKWLASEEVAALASQDPKLGDIFNRVDAPHQQLHQSAVKINRMIQNGNIEMAAEIFNSETEAKLKAVADLFEEAIAYEEGLMKGREKAIAVFKNESEPEFKKTEEMLNRIQNRAQKMLEGQRKAAEIYARKTAPDLQKVQKILGKLRDEVKDNMLTDQAMLKAATGTKRNVAITSVIALIAGILLAFIIARGIVSVLSRITDGLGEGASQVAAASGQVSSASQSMAEGASQQAASIEETSSSMEEMSSMTKKNAENAGQANTLMQEANSVVENANQSMTQLTHSMEEISKASEETSKIIKTIDEIAFQTNLLALNAAVEAARAGEAGAGFAVVADEVRNLAMRAAEAAKSTAELIEGTVKKIDDGSELVNRTNEAFGKVAESADKVGGLIAEISLASKEQSNGIDQVNTAISEMDKVVQQNAANAEESASSAEEMNAQAEQLMGFVGELLMMVSGNKGSGIIKTDHQKTGLVSSNKKKAGSKKKLLHHESKEIGPEQVIPFDEDKDFKDF